MTAKQRVDKIVRDALISERAKLQSERTAANENRQKAIRRIQIARQQRDEFIARISELDADLIEINAQLAARGGVAP